MNQIDFSMLEISVQSKGHSFRDDGFVPDLQAHIRKICIEFTGNEDSYGTISASVREKGTGGRHIKISQAENHTWVIFYTHSDPITEAFVRGHEETHVLHGVGQIHVLEERLTQQGLRVDLSKYGNFENCDEDAKEVVANIGGLYAMEKNGVEIAGIPLEQEDISPESLSHFQPALLLYQDAIRNRRS